MTTLAPNGCSGDSVRMAFDPVDVISLIRDIEEERIPLERVSARVSGVVRGMSGRKFRTLMARLASAMPSDLVYLESGVFQGLTPLVVAASNPGRMVIGVDDFSQFDKNGENLGKIHRAAEMLGVQNLRVHNRDFEQFLVEMREELKQRVGIFFYDASHDYRSQLVALMHGTRLIAPGGLLVVDDCNYPHVRMATADLVTVFPEYKLAFEAYTGKHPSKMSPDETKVIRRTWWNGVHIIVHDPSNKLNGLTPPTPPDLRQQFVKRHGFAGCDSYGAPTRYASMRGDGTPGFEADRPRASLRLPEPRSSGVVPRWEFALGVGRRLRSWLRSK